jgi:hypothetical protein
VQCSPFRPPADGDHVVASAWSGEQSEWKIRLRGVCRGSPHEAHKSGNMLQLPKSDLAYKTDRSVPWISAIRDLRLIGVR